MKYKCSKCGAESQYYYDGSYYCVECGREKSLIKVMLYYQQELSACWETILRIQKKIGGTGKNLTKVEKEALHYDHY